MKPIILSTKLYRIKMINSNIYMYKGIIAETIGIVNCQSDRYVQYLRTHKMDSMLM